MYSKQFGFQKKLSTDYAILELADTLLSSFEKGHFTLGVFIDLSKAFDTVNHKILLSKLQHYKIEGPLYELLANYLTNRKQFISYGENKQTDFVNVTCGVPQGSILGPLLFLIYINDLNNVSSKLNTIKFADDTNLVVTGKDIKSLFAIMNNELKIIFEWCKANKLSLNEDKTMFTLFHSVRHTDNLSLRMPTLTINNYPVKRVHSTRFLGVILDEHITWKSHIDFISKKLTKAIGILYKAGTSSLSLLY